MAYILDAERAKGCTGAFQAYQTYLAASRTKFPPSAYALASSDWYFDFNDHRCPHDSWLESVAISEPSQGERHEVRTSSIRIRLLGAYHDGFIEFVYPEVFSYSLNADSCVRGLGDWRFDEFRVSNNGHLIHEIEWAGFPNERDSRWLIEASDVRFHWIPK